MNVETPNTCPPQADWLELLDPRHREVATDAALHEHLAGCTACQAVADDVRRYQTLLLRGRAPGLTPEQRQSLDERVHLMSGRWQKPPRVSPGFVWGLALATAAALVFSLAMPFLEKSSHNQATFQQMVVDATAPSVDNPGPGAVTSFVEGDVEVAAQDGRWRKLAGGDTLRYGQRVRTPKSGTQPGHIVVPGRFELTLAPNTELDVLAMADRDAFLRLRHGEVGCQVDKLKPGHRYGVMFAGFRASVVGTRFVVRQDENDAGVAVQVTEGAVRVDQADDPYALPGDTVNTVRAGQRWQFAGGRMALEPIPVAAPPAAASVSVAPSAPVLAPASEPVPVVAPAVVAKPLATAGARTIASPAAVAEPRMDPAQHPTRPTQVIQPRPIVIEVPPQHMPPPEQIPVQPAPASRVDAPVFER